MISLANLKPAKGAVKNRKRVGRGSGSGYGKTAGRGMNGQKSRSGYARKRAFEGGQMPLVRRVPKRGFTNKFKTQYNVVNLTSLEKLNVSEIKLEDYFEKRLARRRGWQIKVLGDGDLTRKIKVHAHRFSKTAREKIEKGGGEAILIQGDKR